MNPYAQTKYSVTLDAPLGLRLGSLTLDCLQGACTGQLSLLGASHPLQGQIDPSGHCRFTGVLHTAMLNKPYEAEGTLIDGQLQLTLRFDFGTCRLHGTKEGE